MVLPDKIPEIDGAGQHTTLKGRLNVAYICTFSVDEPWKEVIAAAELLPKDICIYITGRNSVKQEDVPENVVLTGYMPRQDYQNLLHSVDAVMVLTTADENLVCGGYEAVAAGKPLVLSDTRTLRDFFCKGTVFTGNRSDEIARTIKTLDGSVATLTSGIKTLKEEMTLSWQQRWRDLLEQLQVRSA
jgi:glycosyltransferase involved in cell wall biosynthesis